MDAQNLWTVCDSFVNAVLQNGKSYASDLRTVVWAWLNRALQWREEYA